MEKLKLEHVAPYLPYGLKVLSSYNEICEIDSINWSLDGHLRTVLNLMISQQPSTFRGSNLDKIKPILRPMSDLFKLIDWDNNNDTYMLGCKYGIEKVFEDGEEFYANEYHAEQCESPKCYIDIKSFDWWLFVYHFDIFGLIDKGLAIDINTL